MKKLITRLVTLALACGFVSAAQAARVLAINFASGKGAPSANSDCDIPGFQLDGAAFFGSTGGSGSNVSVPAKNQDGTAADGSAKLAFSSSGVWEWDSASSFYKGYLDDNPTSGSMTSVDVTVSEIPFAAYDLYLVAQSDQGTGKFSYKTINGTTYTADENGRGKFGTATWGSTQANTLSLGGNVLVVEDLHGDLVINSPVKNGSTRGCIAALVIVEKDATVEKKMTSCFHLDGTADNAVEGGPALTKSGDVEEPWNTDEGKQAFGSASFASGNTATSYVLEDFNYGLAPKTGWTLSFWVCPNGMATWKDACGFAFGSVRYKIERNGANAFQLYNNSGSDTICPALDNAIAYADNNNSWVNLVFVSNANNDGFDIYANGNFVQHYMAKNGNKAFGTGLPTLTRVAIGVNAIGNGANTSDGRTSPALVDEVAIYNFAATEAQVKWLAANAPSEAMYTGDYAVEISGTVNVSTLAGKTATLVGDATLVVDAELTDTITVIGTANKTLTLADGADHAMTAADYAKIDLGAYKGQIVWNSTYVSGKACWIDYEFNGDMTSTGTDTSALNRDQDNGQYLYGPNAIDDFAKDAEDSAYGLYAGSHPWRNMSGYPNVWTCAIYGTLPEYNDGVLVAFGTQANGFIGLATQDVAQNKIRLVYVNASGTILKEAPMAVPEAFTTPHLYLFTRDGNTITVYLDGKEIATLTNDEGYTFGNGLQIASVHGGTPSCLKRFAPNVFTDGINDPRAKRCVLDAMRLYNVRLGPKAIDALKAEFPYESQIGKFTRTLSGGEANWVATDVWTSGTTTAAQPVADAEVVVTTGSAATTVAVNLDETASYAAVTFTGSVPVTLTAGSAPITAAETTIAAPVTIAYGAYNVSALTIAEGGSLVFDYSAYPIASVTAPVTMVLTGLTQNYGDKVSVTQPAEMASHTMTLKYDADSRTYQLAIALARPAGDLSLPAGDPETGAVTIMNNTVYTDANGNEAIPFYPEDWIVVNREVTVTIGENLTVPAKIKVVDGGVLKLNFASDVTQSGFAYNATVRVEEGGVYDLANADGHKDYSHPIVLAGGKLTNSGIATTVNSRQYWQMSVAEDSTIEVSGNEFGAVNSEHNAHNYYLNGNTLVKTGAGQYTFKTATFVRGGTLQVTAGTVVLDNCAVPEGAVLNFVVAEGARIIVRGNALAKTGTVTGAGTVVYEAGVNTSSSYQDEGWTGTVWVKNMVWNGWDLGRDGNRSSTVKITGVKGYSLDGGCDAEVFFQDEGDTKALLATNGSSSAVYFFRKVSGSGTFGWDIWDETITAGPTGGHIFWLKDASDYSGQLVTGNYLHFKIGATAPDGRTPGAITVVDGATIGAGNWLAKSISFGSTLNVKGTKGAVVATVAPVATEPTFDKVKVSLLDANGVKKDGEYQLKTRAVEGGYEVYVDATGFSVHLR